MHEDLYEKLARLQWLLHKRRMRGWAESGPMADTTRGQGRILAVLKMKDGLSTKDLSYLLGVRVSSLNEILSKLERGGYAVREPSERDKRVMLVRLTEKGRNEEQPETPDFGDVFDCLSEDERRAFGDYLDRIVAALRGDFGVDDGHCARMGRAHPSHFPGPCGHGPRHGHDPHHGHGHGCHGFPGAGGVRRGDEL